MSSRNRTAGNGYELEIAKLFDEVLNKPAYGYVTTSRFSSREKDANCIATNYPGFDNDHTTGDGGVTWQHALDFVAGINDGTYSNCGADNTDWRLANLFELESLFGAQNVHNNRLLYSRFENKSKITRRTHQRGLVRTLRLVVQTAVAELRIQCVTER